MASRHSQRTHRGPLVWLNRVATLGSVVLAVTSTTLYACGPKDQTLDELLRQMRSELLNPSELRVGIIPDQPSLSFRSANIVSGFDADLAKMFGVFVAFREPNVVFHEVKVEDRQRALDPDSGHTDAQVDVVWSSYSITDLRKQFIEFSSTYFVTNQEALVLSSRTDLANSDVQLKTRPVCTTGGSTAEDSLESQGYKNVYGSSTNTACLEGLRDKVYDGFITDHAVLVGIKHKYDSEFKLVDIAYSGDERWGVGVPKDHPAILKLINCFLTDSYLRERSGRNSAWRDAFYTNLAPIDEMPFNTRQPKPQGQSKVG